MTAGTLPRSVKIVEVGPRDGLQNETRQLEVATRVKLVNLLSEAGFSRIECGSFVSPKWIPQMAATDEVFAGISRVQGVIYSALTPNLKGLHAALAAGVDEAAVFTAASETFSQRNINCTIAESYQRFQPLMETAARHNLAVRGYVSCVAGCPYEGETDPDRVLDVTRRLLDMGCYEVSLGDTIGVGTPGSISRLLDVVVSRVGSEKLAIHCHDTYGQALVNIYTAMHYGLRVIDSSIAGLGGCPYARGATGNVATEDVLYLLEGLGIDTGIDLRRAIAAGDFIAKALGRRSGSRVANALAE